MRFSTGEWLSEMGDIVYPELETAMTYIVLAKGPSDYYYCYYGPFNSFDNAHDWAGQEWPSDSQIEFEVHECYRSDDITAPRPGTED